MPIPEAEVVSRRLLRDDVYAMILDAIVSGQLAPGERLRDQDLAAWLGVSRTPVREALLRLERAGLVISKPGSSTTVAPDDPTSVAAAQQVAAALHELATRAAIGRLGEGDFGELDDANAALGDALGTADPIAAARADEAFHQVFVRVADNPVLTETLGQVTPLLRRAVHLRFGEFFSGRQSTEVHERIVEAARRRDAETAGRLARDNWLTLAD